MKAREGFRNEILRILRFALTEVEEEGMFKVVSLAGLGTLSFPDSVASNYGRARRLLLDEAQRAQSQ